MIDMIRDFLPTVGETKLGAAASAIGTVFTYLVGWSDVMEALLVAMVIDYLTGVIAAYINPHMMLNSQRGFRGICKKILILLLVALAHELDRATGAAMIQTVVMWFFIGNEGLSIIENAGKAGVPIPTALRSTLEQLTKRGDKAES